MIPIPVRSAVIIDLHDGMSKRDIGHKYGLSRGIVDAIASEQGLPPRRRRPAADLIRSGSLRVTSHRSMVGWMLTLPDEIINWLVEEAPKDVKPDEFLRAVVIDAYNDAKGNVTSYRIGEDA